MLEPAIQDFFRKRKDDWLNKKIKSSMKEDEIKALKDECEKKFSIPCWLPDAAKRAGQMSISSHPCTFSHPSARKNKNGYVTSVIAKVDHKADGYLRTGNVAAAEDALGNAAVLDVYKFLTLPLGDGVSILEHLQQDSDQAKALLNIPTESYQELKNGLLSMIHSKSSEILTSSKIKQVYFPIVEDEYHLLSVLSNSGIIYELRKRIDDLRFSEKQKELRDLKRNNQFSKTSFMEIYGITTVGYGGTKPQNISVLNNQNGGKARLLTSAPPQLVKREIQFPTNDFFINAIRFYDIGEPLNKLHALFLTGLDSDIPRRNLEKGRDNTIETILDQIIKRMTAVRAVSTEQYLEKTSRLDRYQKIWLCDEYQKQRSEQEEWLDELCEQITRWVMAAYKKVIKKPIALGPAEYNYIHEMIETHRGALK